MRHHNPALRSSYFVHSSSNSGALRLQGVAFKTALLLGLSLLSAAWVWHAFALAADLQTLQRYASGGGMASFVLALATLWRPRWAVVTAPAYALCKGLSLGSLSLVLEVFYPGVARQALPLTFAILAAMLLLYGTGIVRVSPGLRGFVLSAMGGLLLFYLSVWLLRLLGFAVPYLHEGSLLSIGLSLFIVGLASVNLLLDFDFIERARHSGAPRYMEWYSAFALLLTLVWLYLELLQLLVRLRERNRR